MDSKAFYSQESPPPPESSRGRGRGGGGGGRASSGQSSLLATCRLHGLERTSSELPGDSAEVGLAGNTP